MAEEIAFFVELVELSFQRARQGNQEAFRHIGRWRRRACELARARAELAYTDEQAAAVDRWLQAIQPLLFSEP